MTFFSYVFSCLLRTCHLDHSYSLSLLCNTYALPPSPFARHFFYINWISYKVWKIEIKGHYAVSVGLKIAGP